MDQCSPQFHVHPKSQNVILFGNRVFADSPRLSKSYWIRVDSKSNDLLIRVPCEHSGTQREDGQPCEVRAEIEGVWLQAKECKGLRPPAKARREAGRALP